MCRRRLHSTLGGKFYPPLVLKFMQPPLLRLLTMSAFEGTPSPPQCGHHKWKPLYITCHSHPVGEWSIRKTTESFCSGFSVSSVSPPFYCWQLLQFYTTWEKDGPDDHVPSSTGRCAEHAAPPRCLRLPYICPPLHCATPFALEPVRKEEDGGLS